HYRDKNKIDYAFIQSSEQVLKDYAVSSFPIFYFLNENREIVKIIRGYSEGKTDKEINSIINEMIKEHV
ncbi:MAG: TlpA family protein disulfide reductase, partial [Salinivirgaceae bacterium]